MMADELDFDAINRFLNGDDEPQNENESSDGSVMTGDYRIMRVDEVIQETYEEIMWEHNHKIANAASPKTNEALRPTGYRATDTTGMSLDRNGAQVSTRTESQAKRQSDGGFILASLLLAILACIGCGLLAYIADFISLVGV